MERPPSQPSPLLSHKSSSFSTSTTRVPDRSSLRQSDRNLSLGAICFDQIHDVDKDKDLPQLSIHEESEENSESACEITSDSKEDNADNTCDLTILSDEINGFLATLTNLSEESPPPEIPDAVEKFVALVEKEIIKFEVGESSWRSDPGTVLSSFDRLSKLADTFRSISGTVPKYCEAMNRAGSVQHHAMSFLEDEFFALLDDNSSEKTQPYSPEAVEKLRDIAQAMIAAGYETECYQVFSVARRNALEAVLSELGYEKKSIEEIQSSPWKSLGDDIAAWIKALRHVAGVSFAAEKCLCDHVFACRPDLARALYCNLARAAVLHLLNFAEAVAMTKRSAEKLFKVLDMYETLRDIMPNLDDLFPGSSKEDDNDEDDLSSSPNIDLKSEVHSTRSLLGEAAVAMFCDLESSMKGDNSKNTVPGGAVHPSTRYVMNYLEYVCEYNKTLEQVFQEHQKTEQHSSYSEQNEDDHENGEESNHQYTPENRNNNSHGGDNDGHQSPFAMQLAAIMDLLQSNLEAKSKLYKDLALSSIFLMNNGRYIVQKIKGSAEMNQLLGNTWCRKKSSELRQYHKNYQRETWSKVLAVLKDEGLNTNGRVSKPVLKERFKSFNAMFEEIHKMQSSWVVSDEQLQSELRVSVSAVVVPAYRSFLGRYQQYLDAGRQTEKYIKFGAEDLETYIDDLFDGNPSASMVKRRT